MNAHLHLAQNRAEHLRAEAQQDRQARAVRSERHAHFQLPNLRTLFRWVQPA